MGGSIAGLARAGAMAGLLCMAGVVAADVAPARTDGDVVVVRRGGAEVTLADVDARMEEMPVEQRAGFMNSPERIDTTLQQLLLAEQLANAAVEAGLDRDPRLAAQLELLRKRLLGGLQMEHMRKQVQAGIDVTAIARERYAADRSRFVEPEVRSVRHVLVSTSKRAAAEATARVQEIQRRLAAGETLAALAAELSDDEGSRSAGGLIADIPRGRTDPAFEEATFALRTPGEVTPAPVQSQFGYHLIELVSIKPERQRSFEEVKAELEAAALAQVVDARLRAYSDGLSSLPIEADPDVVESLRTRYGAVQPLPADAPANGPSQAAAQPRR
jgi:peptidyl-prolyl cis-trans isomerase C